MPETILTTDELARQEQAAAQHLREVLGLSPAGAALNLTGLEFLAFLGAKVALPIACGFVSRLLYDKYTDLKKSKVDAARKELAAMPLDRREPVEESRILADQTRVLVDEGIPEAEAKVVVERAIMRLKAVLPA